MAKRATSESIPATIRCHKCGKAREVKMSADGKRPLCPKSWKDIIDGPYAGVWCDGCWDAEFVPRSITIPVVGPVTVGRGKAKPVAAEWKDLRAALKKCWGWSTDVANWATMELMKWDPPRTAAAEKLGPAPTRTNPYLYPGVELIAPGMDSQAKIAVLNTVLHNYKAKRYEVIWLRKAKFPTYGLNKPYPYVVDKDGWKPTKSPKDGRPCILVSLAGEKWTLLLAGGFRNRRKIDGWKRVFSGEAIRREIAIEARTVTASAHRSGTASKAPGGGQAKSQRVMVRISAWFPRKEANQVSDKVMECRTGGAAFLSYRIGSDGAYRHIYADHVRRWRNQDAERNRRFAHDMKREKRWTSRARRAMEGRREKDRAKFRNRMDTWLNEATKIVAEHAYRRKACRVVFDMTDRSFAPGGFPWSKLKKLMECKLGERRIAIEVVGYKDEAGEGENEEATRVPRMQAAGRRGGGNASAGLSARADGPR